MTIEERLTELLNNEKFMAAIREATTPQDLQQVLTENDIQLKDASVEEAFNAFQQSKNKELDMEQLEGVSGGGGMYFAFKIAKDCIYIAASGASGTIIMTVAALALIGLATYAGYRYIRKHV